MELIGENNSLAQPPHLPNANVTNYMYALHLLYVCNIYVHDTACGKNVGQNKLNQNETQSRTSMNALHE